MTSIGNSNNHSDKKTVKIMTYNVWFREELELIRRMNAIGDLIQHHSPDLMLPGPLFKLCITYFPLLLGFRIFICGTAGGHSKHLSAFRKIGLVASLQMLLAAWDGHAKTILQHAGIKHFSNWDGHGNTILLYAGINH